MGPVRGRQVHIPAGRQQGRKGAGARPRWARRRTERAITLVEFALVAPLLFLVLSGLLVLGVAIANQIQLSNAVRDGARAAAICGGAGASGSLYTTTTTLPDNQPCTTRNLVIYVNNSLTMIPDSSPQFVVIVGGSRTTDLSSCEPGRIVEVTATFKQPLYLPLVGALLGDAGNPSVRTLNAEAEATCEQ